MGTSSGLPATSPAGRPLRSSAPELIELSARSDVLFVSGDVDRTTALRLAAELWPLVERGGQVSVDCHEVSFMSAAGVRVLDHVAKMLGPQGRLVVLDPSFAVRRALEIVGVQQRIEVRESGRGDSPALPREASSRERRRGADTTQQGRLVSGG